MRLRGALVLAALWAGTLPASERTLIFPEKLGMKHHCASLAELGDGSLLAAWYYGHTHHGESDVGGAILASLRRRGTWSEPFVLFDSYRDAEGNPLIFWNPVTRRLHLVTGTMRADFDWKSLTTHWLTADVASARDVKLGEFWPIRFGEEKTLKDGEWRDIDPKKGDRGFLLRNKPVRVGRRLLMPIYKHVEERLVGFMAMDPVSERWEKPRLLRGAEAEQPALVSLGGRRLLMLTRNTSNDPEGTAWASRSGDGGRSWSPIRAHPNLRNVNNSLDLVRLPDGRLLAVHNTDRSRRRLDLSVSRDDGRSWTLVETLEDAPRAEFSYPTMLLSRDGRTVHLVYSFYRRTIAYRSIAVRDL